MKLHVLYSVCLALLLIQFGCDSGTRKKVGEPEAKAPGSGKRNQLILESVPSGAGVWQGRELLGRTPLEVSSCLGEKLVVRHPGCGDVEVTIGSDGFKTASETLSLKQNDKKCLTGCVRLPEAVQASCMLVCNTMPAGAEVLLDGESRGVTPLEITGLEPRVYEVTFKLAGHEEVSRKVSWHQGEQCKTLEEYLVSQTLKLYRGKIAAEPGNMLHYADLGHYFMVEGRLADAMDVYKAGLKCILERKASRDQYRLWAEIERVTSVQYKYGDERTVQVARRLLLDMLDELYNEYPNINEISFYVNYINVAHRLQEREAAQAKLDVAFKKWPKRKEFENFLRYKYVRR